MPTARSGLQEIRGFISGVQLANGDAIALDSYGRSFPINLTPTNYIGPNSFDIISSQIDQHELSSHAEYLVNGGATNVPTALGPLRLGVDSRSRFNGPDGTGMAPTTNSLLPKQYTIGFPRLYQNGKFNMGVQYTSLNTSPWFNFTGAWGSVANSGTLEHVFSYQSQGFVHRAAWTYTSTNLTPGLITGVKPIIGAWAESGYRYADFGRIGDLGMYLGIKPTVLSGSLNANLPTSVDMQGNTVYTSTKLNVMSNVTPYVRALYTNSITKNSMYRLSGQVTSVGTWRTMAELRYTFQ